MNHHEFINHFQVLYTNQIKFYKLYRCGGNGHGNPRIKGKILSEREELGEYRCGLVTVMNGPRLWGK
jgi:hypothetical protein